jgi:hypothetical protein
MRFIAAPFPRLERRSLASFYPEPGATTTAAGRSMDIAEAAH